ncbi:hypothetical protein [Spiroplasma endosymbiont of Glossina fuscipes fuscipes]|uniref:hypothetical protein n=1 Tax=Spiroplasma endosymbiont of Glossina fuscipes fuscipes TaxID=2004463 RepID=UPI003C7544DD
MQGTQWFKSLYEKNASVNMYTRNGLSLVNMEIDDCIHNQEPDFSHINNCKYKLVFDGYQRIKVNELLEYIDYMNENIDDDNWFNISSYLKDNEDWLTKYYDWIKDYLKDEEYCIIYFINKAETFKANRRELK